MVSIYAIERFFEYGVSVHVIDKGIVVAHSKLVVSSITGWNAWVEFILRPGRSLIHSEMIAGGVAGVVRDAVGFGKFVATVKDI
jgi:hypothetical protein